MDMHQHWNDLDRTVKTAISAGQIGAPRSVRVTLHGLETELDSERLNGEVMRSASSWFFSDPDTVSSLTKIENLFVILAKWESGATALISISTGQTVKTGGDIALLGSKGAIFHRIPGDAR